MHAASQKGSYKRTLSDAHVAVLQLRQCHSFARPRRDTGEILGSDIPSPLSPLPPPLRCAAVGGMGGVVTIYKHRGDGFVLCKLIGVNGRRYASRQNDWHQAKRPLPPTTPRYIPSATPLRCAAVGAVGGVAATPKRRDDRFVVCKLV